jgi:hypothetical protein
MAVPDGALLQKIGEAIAHAADGPWRSSTLSITGAAALIGTELAIERPDGSVDTTTPLEHDVLDWCDELRDEMFTEGEGTWYNATITVTDDGQIDTTFDYDNPPFAGEDDLEDLLLDDQEEYPRRPDRLPEWHPAKASRS